MSNLGNRLLKKARLPINFEFRISNFEFGISRTARLASEPF